MKVIARVTALSMILVAGSPLADTLYYPNQKQPEFSVEVPDDWEIKKEKEDDGILRITAASDDGAVFEIGTTTFSDEDDLKAVIAAAAKRARNYLKENYKNVKFQNPKKDEDGTYVGAGEGVYMEDDTKYTFVNVLFVGAGKVAEIWTECPEGDEESEAEIKGIIESLKDRTVAAEDPAKTSKNTPSASPKEGAKEAPAESAKEPAKEDPKAAPAEPVKETAPAAPKAAPAEPAKEAAPEAPKATPAEPAKEPVKEAPPATPAEPAKAPTTEAPAATPAESPSPKTN